MMGEMAMIIVFRAGHREFSSSCFPLVLFAHGWAHNQGSTNLFAEWISCLADTVCKRNLEL
jgi:hypothetical protein